ncbi:MAG TPA: FecR domain-containing protein [Sunxiuqinia sp.]|nr:FecR domain-containing protein [Sunxiuqinia sp.]
MKQEDRNHQNETGKELTMEKLQEQLDIPFSKSKADVWKGIEARVDAAPLVRKINLSASPVFRFAMAASIVFVLGVAGVIRFYSVTRQAFPGHHQLVDLPDGSTVHLNAASSLSYHPYWWRFSRDVSFEGEGYFEVEKGSRFQVNSERGTTTVMGTSFDIYSRDAEYRVACLTGKVRVADRASKAEVIITPNQKAILTEQGTFNVQKNVDLTNETAWVHKKLIFTSKPLNRVFEEIERQYGVKILGKEKYKRNYTGNFDRDLGADEVLGFVCKTMGIKFEQKSTNVYQLRN